MSRNTIAKAESGTDNEPSRLDGRNIARIANALDVEMDRLLVSKAWVRVEHGSREELIKKIMQTLEGELRAILEVTLGSIVVELLTTPRGIARLKKAIADGEYAPFGNVELEVAEGNEESTWHDVGEEHRDNGFSSQAVSMERRRPWARALAGLAVAASLMVAGAILDRVFLRPTVPGGSELLVAQARTTRVPGRDPSQQLPAIEISSEFSGFATIISLAPGRAPVVRPALGGDDYPVSADQINKPIVLPEDTTNVVFVVTQTPSGEPIRRIRDHLLDLGPADSDRIRDELQRALEEKGYRRIAFGEASF